MKLLLTITRRGLVLATAALAIAAASPAAAPKDAALGLGQLAPEFALATLDGQTVRLSQLRGRFVVVHFAATWCPFCNAEAPHLELLHKTYRDRGVQVLIVDIGESKRIVQRSAQKLGFTFPVLLDADGSAAKLYAPPKSVQPDLGRDEVMVASNLLIDRDGRIRFFSLLDSAAFDAKLTALRAVLDDLLTKP